MAWLPCFHQQLKAMVIHNLKWPGTFRNPTNNLSSIHSVSELFVTCYCEG